MLLDHATCSCLRTVELGIVRGRSVRLAEDTLFVALAVDQHVLHAEVQARRAFRVQGCSRSYSGVRGPGRTL